MPGPTHVIPLETLAEGRLPTMRKRVRTLGGPLRLLACLLVLACGGNPPPSTPPAQNVPRNLRPFLIPPLEGFALTVGETTRQQLEQGFTALTAMGDRTAARQTADELLRQQPDLPPALVLEAQVAVADGDTARASQLLGPVAEAYPEYTAAQLLLGRIAEALEDPIGAFVAYRSIALRSDIAQQRAAAVQEAALQGAYNALQDELERRHIAVAEGWLDRLREWAPDGRMTLLGSLAIAHQIDDREHELEALRKLNLDPGTSRELQRRQAELEVEVGDPKVAARLFTQLLEDAPSDPRLLAGLSAAQCRSRLETLNEQAYKVLQHPVLTRGDFATLIYWLLPQLRYATTSASIILEDVPSQHPQSQEIIHVVNLGVMRLDDPEVRRFAPDRPIHRVEALDALLRLPGVLGEHPACLASRLLANDASPGRVCEASAACGLLGEEGACLEQAAVSSLDAKDLVCRGLELAKP